MKSSDDIGLWTESYDSLPPYFFLVGWYCNRITTRSWNSSFAEWLKWHTIHWMVALLDDTFITLWHLPRDNINIFWVKLMDKLFAFLSSNWILYITDLIKVLKYEQNGRKMYPEKKTMQNYWKCEKIWDKVGKANKNHRKKGGHLLTNHNLLDKLQSEIEFAQ